MTNSNSKYFTGPDGMYLRTANNESIRFTNFRGCITKEWVGKWSDGYHISPNTRIYEVRLMSCFGVPNEIEAVFEVKASDFHSNVSRYVIKHLGARAIIEPMNLVNAHIVAAIQHRSL